MIASRLGPVLLAALLVASACSNSGDDASGDSSSSTDGLESASANVLQRDGTPVEADEATATGDDEADVSAEQPDAGELSFPPAPDNYLTWAHYVQPAGLANAAQIDGGLFTVSWLREALFESLYSVDSQLEYVPELLAGDARVTANSNGTLNLAYTLRPDLTWSDGEPLTADDVEFTHRILLEGCLTEADGSILDASNEGCVFPLADRNGYDLVTNFEVTGERTFEVALAAFYPDWRGLYRHVLPEHADGDDAAQVADALSGVAGSESSLASSGPLVLDGWDQSTMMLARNDVYHGSVHPDAVNDGLASVAGVQVNFVRSVGSARAAVADGSADIMVSTVGSEILDLLEGGDVAAVVGPALEYDHLGMNRLNRHLADPLVRSAVVQALGRRQAVTAGYGRLLQSPGIRAGQSTIEPDGVGSAYLLPSQAGYEDNQPESLEPNVEEAARLLTEAGYSPGFDGVYSHPDRGALTLRFSTNSGDNVRTDVQDVLIDQLSAAGFKVVTDNSQGGSFLLDGPFNELAIAASLSGGERGNPELWDLTLFAWAGGPWPGLQSGSFRSDSEANPYGFENPEFDAEAARCDTISDDGDRSACYQDLDLFVTTTQSTQDGLFVVPLVERPSMLLYSPTRLSQVPVFTDGDDGGPLSLVVDYVLAGGGPDQPDGGEEEDTVEDTEEDAGQVADESTGPDG